VVASAFLRTVALLAGIAALYLARSHKEARSLAS
jgi:hypothetical protein